MSDADFGQKLQVSLAGPGFEITAKGIGNQSGNPCNLIEIYLFMEIIECKFINVINSVIFGIQQRVLETNGR